MRNDHSLPPRAAERAPEFMTREEFEAAVARGTPPVSVIIIERLDANETTPAASGWDDPRMPES